MEPISHVRVIAENGHKHRVEDWADAVLRANKTVRALSDTFRELELLESLLADQGLHLNADLGPVGDAARAAYRDTSVETPRTFALPAA